MSLQICKKKGPCGFSEDSEMLVSAPPQILLRILYRYEHASLDCYVHSGVLYEVIWQGGHRAARSWHSQLVWGSAGFGVSRDCPANIPYKSLAMLVLAVVTTSSSTMAATQPAGPMQDEHISNIKMHVLTPDCLAQRSLETLRHTICRRGATHSSATQCIAACC